MKTENLSDDENDLPPKVKQYSFRGKLGKGSFSTVYLALNEENGEYFACKVVNKSTIDKLNIDGLIKNELLIWKELSHPFIINLIDYFQDENNLYYVMEYCPNGDLFVLLNNTGRLRESQAAKITKMILESISYIHSLNIAHRDLKPENILFDKFGNVKIADFGLSIKVESSVMSNFCGSMGYISPECFVSSIYDPKKSDLFAIGVIVYSMVTNLTPWDITDAKKLFEAMENENFLLPSYLSPNCQLFITALLKADPEKRMSLDQCLHHPWIIGGGFPYIKKSNSKSIFSPSSSSKKPISRIDKSSIFCHVSPKRNPKCRFRKRTIHDIDLNWALSFKDEDEELEENKKSEKEHIKKHHEKKKSIFFPPMKS